ncbi:MAG: exosortase-associated EpsI family protein [Verrucomicrobiota bacterium]
MKKTPWIFFLIGLAMIGSTAGFLIHVKGNQRLGLPGVLLGNTPLFDESTNRVADVTVILPTDVLSYESAALPITSIELTMLPKDTTFGKRRYWIPNTLQNVDVGVVLMGQDRTSLHKPQFCLVGQGWTIEKTEKVNVKMERPYPYELPMMKLTASIRLKDDSGALVTVRGIYAYWFVADKKLTASHNERMVSMAKNLLRTGTLERWAYISYFSRCYPGNEEETFNEMKKFIAKSAPQFQLAAGQPLQSALPTNVQTAFK